MMRVLAVTGGIGSGKSYVVKMFAAMGVPVYDADMRTKQLYDADKGLLAALTEALGGDILLDGRLDRARMAAKIFSDRQLLAKVEETVHPYVLADMRRWIGEQEDAGKAFAIIESAVFLEKPSFSSLADKVLTVSCPLETRIARVMERSGSSREEVLARITNQWSDERRRAGADFEIVSDFRHALLPQVYDIYLKMKNWNPVESF